MGLDMYLRKNVVVRCWKSGKTKVLDAEKVDISVKITYPDGTVDNQDFDMTKPETNLGIALPVAYWRKANAIHRWFVEQVGNGVDDCKPICMLGKKLIELRDLCEQVLKDHSKAPELLPTQSGCFFGSTEYDEYYYDDLSHTLDVLKNIDEDDIYEYQASW